MLSKGVYTSHIFLQFFVTVASTQIVFRNQMHPHTAKHVFNKQLKSKWKKKHSVVSDAYLYT